VTTPHGSRARGFWIDTGMSSHTVVHFMHTSETSSSNLCIAWHSRLEHVRAFTAGNDLPANRSNTIELSVCKENYLSLLVERSKSGNVDPTKAPNKERLSSPCMNDRG